MRRFSVASLLFALVAALLSVVSPAAASPTSYNLMANGGFEEKSAHWVPGNGTAGFDYFAYDDASKAQTGRHFMAMKTATPGRSLAQTVKGDFKPGDVVTAGISIRPGGGAPVAGTVALWALGGAPDVRARGFRLAGDSGWRTIYVDFTLAAPASALKMEVYADTPGATYFLDSAGIQATWHNGGFERNTEHWAPGNGSAGLDYTVYRDPSVAHSGHAFLATKTAVPGRSIAQTTSGTFFARDTYTFDVYVRSATAQPLKGRLALWGIGGGTAARTEGRISSFEVGSAWTKVSVSRRLSSPREHLKLEMYLDTVGVDYFVDSASRRYDSGTAVTRVSSTDSAVDLQRQMRRFVCEATLGTIQQSMWAAGTVHPGVNTGMAIFSDIYRGDCSGDGYAARQLWDNSGRYAWTYISGWGKDQAGNVLFDDFLKRLDAQMSDQLRHVWGMAKSLLIEWLLNMYHGIVRAQAECHRAHGGASWDCVDEAPKHAIADAIQRIQRHST